MNVTQIFNLALNAIGARNNVASPTEISREAEVCSLWYEVMRDQIFASAPWPELTKLASLELLNTADGEAWTSVNARPGYTYAYALPDDCARPQYITDFSRFLITSYGDGQALSSNTASAVLAYTSKDLGPDHWSAGLRMGIVYALASHICMPLSGKVSRAKQMVDQANNYVMQARENAANSSNEEFEHVPDWIAARGYNGGTQSTRFIYPYGDMLTVPNV